MFGRHVALYYFQWNNIKEWECGCLTGRLARGVGGGSVREDKSLKLLIEGRVCLACPAQHILPPLALGRTLYSLHFSISLSCSVFNTTWDSWWVLDTRQSTPALPSLASFHCSNSNCEKNKFSSSYPHQLFPSPISVFTLINLIGVNTLLWWEHSDIIW